MGLKEPCRRCGDGSCRGRSELRKRVGLKGMTRIDDDLLNELRNLRCEICGHSPPSQVHHLMSRGMGGGSRVDHPLNLISVCGYCHAAIHNGKILGKVCMAVVALREGKTLDEMYDARWEWRKPT